MLIMLKVMLNRPSGPLAKFGLPPIFSTIQKLSGSNQGPMNPGRCIFAEPRPSALRTVLNVRMIASIDPANKRRPPLDGETLMTISAISTTTVGRASLGTTPFRSGSLAARNLRVVNPDHTAEDPAVCPERAKTHSWARIAGGSIAFGDFRIMPGERLLLKGGSPVHVGARAFDVLLILAERAGQVVSRQEIEARVYAGLRVSEGALRFQIGALRKALGEGRGQSRYIANVNGRGYCLAAPVVRSEENQPLVAARPNNAPRLHPPKESSIFAAAQLIRAAVENRPESEVAVSANATPKSSDGQITVVFFLLGRRATLILDDPSSVDCRSVGS
jgi:DNA-binding winged helix-turn-helix (wHTH) protein